MATKFIPESLILENIKSTTYKKIDEIEFVRLINEFDKKQAKRYLEYLHIIFKIDGALVNHLNEIVFENCKFSGVLINGIDIVGSEFRNCDFEDVTFHKVNLKKTLFIRIWSKKMTLFASNISNAEFENVRILAFHFMNITSSETEESKFLSCFFGNKSSITSCVFVNSKFISTIFDKNIKLNTVAFEDCFFNDSDTKKLLTEIGATISFSKYKVMSWEIMTNETIHTSYVCTFFTGFKEHLNNVYKDQIIAEWEYTNKPSIVLNITTSQDSFLPSLTLEVQKQITDFISKIIEIFEKLSGNEVKNVATSDDVLDFLYSIFGYKKTIQHLSNGNMVGLIKDYEDKPIDTSFIFKIDKINLITGDNNVIGDGNKKYTFSLFKK